MKPQIVQNKPTRHVVFPLPMVGHDDQIVPKPQNIRAVRLSIGLTNQEFPRAILIPSRDYTLYEALDASNVPIPLAYWHACLYGTSNGSETLLKAAKALNESLYRRAALEAKTNHTAEKVLQYLKREHDNGNTNIYYINVRLYLLLTGEPAPYKALRDAEGIKKSSLKGRKYSEDRLAAIREQRAVIKAQREYYEKESFAMDAKIIEAQARAEIALKELAAKKLELAYKKRYTRNKKA